MISVSSYSRSFGCGRTEVLTPGSKPVTGIKKVPAGGATTDVGVGLLVGFGRGVVGVEGVDGVDGVPVGVCVPCGGSVGKLVGVCVVVCVTGGGSAGGVLVGVRVGLCVAVGVIVGVLTIGVLVGT